MRWRRGSRSWITTSSILRRVCRLLYKLKDGVGKRILKQAAAPYLDADIINRKKQGFGAPMEEWFREGDFGRRSLRRSTVQR